MFGLRVAVAGFAIGSLFLLADERIPAQAVPVQAIVTVEARHDKEAPALKQDDVMVLQRNERLEVRGFVPCQGEHAGLQLFVLIDEASGTTIGSQFGDLRHFIETQPATTSIGIGYMRNAMVAVAQDLTADHGLAAKALRLPLGSPGVMASPFLSLSSLIKRWPAGPDRREALLVTSGTDPMGGGILDPYLDSAIADAQRAGIIVYAIYWPSTGHFGHSFWRMNWGQNHLAQIAEETGGEAYMLGFGPPVSFEPYLKELAAHLAHQYLVEFFIKPEEKAGFQSIRFATEVPNAEIVGAAKVYVPAGH